MPEISGEVAEQHYSIRLSENLLSFLVSQLRLWYVRAHMQLDSLPA